MEQTLTAPVARSLVEQARQLSPPLETPPPAGDRDPASFLPDGYRRLTPVQPYCVPEAWRRRQKLLIALSAVLIVAAVGGAGFLLSWLLRLL